jgi:predicted NBD/HSP70 family sugar kinase
MTHFVGLDVSQKMTAICVVDPAGNRIWRGVCASAPEQMMRRYATTLATMPALALRQGR